MKRVEKNETMYFFLIVIHFTHKGKYFMAEAASSINVSKKTVYSNDNYPESSLLKRTSQ